MAESSIPVSSGSGNNVDVFTLTNPANLRQSVVVGDSVINANVAPVQATDPISNAQGLVVRDVNTSAIVSKLSSGVVVTPGTGTFQVFLPDTGHELGSIRGITNSINVYLGSTAGTIVVKIDPAGAVFTNNASTAGIFNTSGNNSSAVSVSGATVISPSANYSFKIYAFGITSTAQSNILVKFTNGAGTSPTEFMRYALWAPAQGIAGANLAVTPPGYLFATGTNTTLSLVTDSASLVHYWFSYFKETA